MTKTKEKRLSKQRLYRLENRSRSGALRYFATPPERESKIHRGDIERNSMDMYGFGEEKVGLFP